MINSLYNSCGDRNNILAIIWIRPYIYHAITSLRPICSIRRCTTIRFYIGEEFDTTLARWQMTNIRFDLRNSASIYITRCFTANSTGILHLFIQIGRLNSMKRPVQPALTRIIILIISDHK
ncbi:MAG: hypothetical protein ETSY2_16780 [Candidatus Entotheonella gemina]|uniref:Uncharacterized protein n=1 Tax=Candidatus Entotheonella gemina TaxID=1429439 RepID=W4M802_9BACT|nr:MAG: hypothetical protein ETSY2_16780 [Candidatus Entotheonella gemina]